MGTPQTTDALLSAAEVRDLIARAGQVLEGVSLGDLFDGDEEETEVANRRLSIGMEAYRFALRNAEALEDPSLLDAVLATLDIHDELLWDDEGVLSEIFPEVLTSMISLVRGTEPLIDELVTHPTTAVRAAVAAGLRPRTRWARAHLETLAHDFWPSVRVPAQETLRTKREVPTWWGRFERDPLEGLAPRAAAALRPLLEALHPLFDTGDWALIDAVRTGKLAEALDRLPALLGAGLAERVLRAGMNLYGKPAGLFPLVLRGPDAGGFVERWLSDWKDVEEVHVPMADELGDTLRSLPENLGNPLRARLLERMTTPPDDLYRHPGFRRRVNRVLGRCWPYHQDPTPLLDLLLALPNDPDEALSLLDLSQALRHTEVVPDAVLERMLAAQQEGWPGNWSVIRSFIEDKINAVPPERLRPLAERAQHHADDRVATWALRQLIHPLHDARFDPPRAKRIAAYWKDPRARRLLIEAEPSLVLPLLRAELRAGRLGLAHATITMTQINHFYGGVGPVLPPFGGDASTLDEFRRQGRHAYRDLLGPSSLRGPPSDAEWEAFRAIRSQEFEALLPLDERLASQAVEAAPPGDDWDPADRALFWRAVKVCFQTKNDRLTLALLRLMQHKPLREDMLILEKLHRIDAAGWGLGHSIRSEIRKSLGLDAAVEEDEPDDEPPPPAPSANE